MVYKIHVVLGRVICTAVPHLLGHGGPSQAAPHTQAGGVVFQDGAEEMFVAHKYKPPF